MDICETKFSFNSSRGKLCATIVLVLFLLLTVLPWQIGNAAGDADKSKECAAGMRGILPHVVGTSNTIRAATDAPANVANESLVSAITRMRSTLEIFGKKDPKGDYEVSDAKTKEIKVALARFLGTNPDVMRIPVDPKTGSAFTGDSMRVVVKKPGSNSVEVFIIDRLGNYLKVDEPDFQVVFTKQDGTPEVMTYYYNGEGYRIAVGAKICSGTIDSDRSGGIDANVTTPRGEKITIELAPQTLHTLRVNGKPPVRLTILDGLPEGSPTFDLLTKGLSWD